MKTGYRRFDSIEERYKARIEENKLSKKSQKILWDWAEERRGNGYRDVNTIGMIGTIINMIEQIGKDITSITKQDLQKFFGQEKLKQTTELWYKKCLKRFYKWLSQHKDDVKYLMVVNWIDTKQLSSKCSQQAFKKREDNLLTPEEVRKMISKATLLRDKLAIALLSDTGVRAESVGHSHSHEARSINCGQIEFHKGYAVIKDIEEKFDKKRDVVVTEALSYLIKYFNEHPNRNDPKAPLFLNYSTNRRGQRWGYSGLKGLINKISEEAIGRHINPHDFRHLKSTRLHLDDNLSDEAKCKLMGWSSRRMLDRYTHTTFEQAKDELLAKKGIIKIEKGKRKVEQVILRAKECLVCHNINAETDTICEKCGNTLDYEKIIVDYTKRKEAENDIGKFMKYPEIQELFKKIYKMEKQLSKVSKN